MEFYQHNEVLVSMIVFALGFIFDIFTIRRIDSFTGLVQQGIYLILLCGFLVTEIRGRVWRYHDLVVHFLFGSLLSLYTIFYFNSTSALTSFLYILLLAGLLLANEFHAIRKLGLKIRIVLFTICTLSYFSFFYPILFGRVGAIPFWLGFLSSFGALTIVALTSLKHVRNLKKEVIAPAIGVHLFFLFGYYLSLIPPVPVAVKKIGIYYEVEKKEGQYIGKHLGDDWKFWQKGSQDFEYRPGDKVVVLLSVFSPTRFQDQIYLRWYFEGKLEDSIPLNILGGRDEGFRGFGSKQFVRPGNWKVLVETSDGREVGSISFELTNDIGAIERTFKNDVF